MSELVSGILIVLTLAVMGGFVSLIILLPPLRRVGRRSPMTRSVAIFTVGLLSLAAGFALLTWIFAVGQIVLADSQFHMEPLVSTEAYQARKFTDVAGEIWRRRRNPPPLRRPCYTPDIVVCEGADQVLLYHPTGDWGPYTDVTVIGYSLISALAGGFLTWFFVKPGRG